MKKKIFCIFFVLLFILLSSCNSGTPTNSNSDTQEGSDSSNAADSGTPVSGNINASIQQSDFFVGIGEESLVFFTDVREMVSERLDLTIHKVENAQIYIDPYPIGDGGAEFEITQAVTDKAAEHFRKFIGALQMDVAVPQPYENMPWLLITELENNRIVTGPDFLNAYAEIPNIDAKLTVSDVEKLLTQNKYLIAALEMLEIKEPYIEKHISHDNEGGIQLSFVVTENSSDTSQLALNKNLRHIELVTDEGYKGLFIRISLIDLVIAENSTATVSYDDAVARVLEENPDRTKKDILACELVYNCVLSKGYWVPCYQFYLDEGVEVIDNSLENPTSGSKKEFKNAKLYYVAACDISGLKAPKA